MNIHQYLPQVTQYLQSVNLDDVPDWCETENFTVHPLAQGEYNMNYLVRKGDKTWVIRVNIGTQIQREDQIIYEYKALELLKYSGVTPEPYYVDDSREHLDYGVLIMEYLPGESLDYQRDLLDAAKVFARIHSTPVPREKNHLIQETTPLSMTYEECARLLPIYFSSPLADPELRDYLRDVLDWAEQARHQERYFTADPITCIINTEVNSGNFIANRRQNTLHLVDWEKPLYGDPSQDLSHFCAPMTTLWKTPYRMTGTEKQQFITCYRNAISDRHLADTIVDRVKLRDPFNYLRGISWSAMAWVAYQTDNHALKNQDTFNKICTYLDIDFQREMFDPYLTSGAG